MKRILTSPVRWILGLAVIAFASYLTGLSFLWCLLAYLGIIFLVEFAKNMFVVILGIIMVIGLSLALFFGLLAL
jgi:hypothetical protein